MTDTFKCHNIKCKKELGVDHVTLVTTRHMRRFCSVECIIEGHKAREAAIAAAVFAATDFEAAHGVDLYDALSLGGLK